MRQEPAQPGRSATAAQQKPRGRGDARGEARAEARGEARGGGTAAGYTQLFVSAGRNRRVHARDLVQLFRDRLALPEGRLGAVRVFEKYSFVEVPTSLASDAVTRLNGQEFAGRPLTVEVAKRHEGEPGRA